MKVLISEEYPFKITLHVGLYSNTWTWPLKRLIGSAVRSKQGPIKDRTDAPSSPKTFWSESRPLLSLET